MQAVYEADLRGFFRAEQAAALAGKARRIAEGVLAERESLDAAIDEASDHWRIDRMPAVDRAILRVALYELRHESETPTAVILNEAVRIAKEFSTEHSGRFVNGMLSTLASHVRT